MKRSLPFLVLSIAVLLLAGCTGSSVEQQPDDTLQSESNNPEKADNLTGLLGVTRVDEQSGVTVEVTPGTIDDTTITFEVVMDTHSVDLGMDLTILATLSNERGLMATPSLWRAPAGSEHHVSGTLVFPVQIDGVSLLAGVTHLTLTIREVAVSERVFVWDVNEEG